MTEKQVIDAIDPKTETIETSVGPVKVTPVKVKNIFRLLTILKELQINIPAAASELAVTMAILTGAGDRLGEILGLVLNAPEDKRLDDITMIDLSQIALSVVKVNDIAQVKETFIQAAAVVAKKSQK